MFLIPVSSYSVRTVPKKGRAVFAAHDIEAGTIIGDYLGKLMHPKDEDEERHGLYTIALNEKTDVLGNPKKSGIHLINHSCAPNCEIYPLKGHMLYVAVRKIFKGEELTVDYLLDPPYDEKMHCPHTCHCGTILCRGTMHASFEVTEKWEEFVSKKLGAYKKKSLGKYGTELAPLSSYPESVPDVPLWTLVANLEVKPTASAEHSLPPLSLIRLRIRNSGRPLAFLNLKLTVLGVVNGLVIMLPSQK